MHIWHVLVAKITLINRDKNPLRLHWSLDRTLLKLSILVLSIVGKNCFWSLCTAGRHVKADHGRQRLAQRGQPGSSRSSKTSFILTAEIAIWWKPKRNVQYKQRLIWLTRWKQLHSSSKLNQGIIDWKGTETRQIFSRMFVRAKKWKSCLLLL